ncbi:MAG: hypothetical protein MUO72_06475 [Bacteroidales bacterium]|nr:hypothetical protein [Bacteroidales bacterium]
MRWIKYISILIVIFLTIKCERIENDANSLILGEWRLIEVYGERSDHTFGWFTVQESPILTTKYNPNGKYAIYADGSTICIGDFVFESSNTLKLNPHDCMPRWQSVETIYKLTPDTLIISNTSNSLSSSRGQIEKYIKYN